MAARGGTLPGKDDHTGNSALKLHPKGLRQMSPQRRIDRLRAICAPVRDMPANTLRRRYPDFSDDLPFEFTELPDSVRCISVPERLRENPRCCWRPRADRVTRQPRWPTLFSIHRFHR